MMLEIVKEGAVMSIACVMAILMIEGIKAIAREVVDKCRSDEDEDNPE